MKGPPEVGMSQPAVPELGRDGVARSSGEVAPMRAPRRASTAPPTFPPTDELDDQELFSERERRPGLRTAPDDLGDEASTTLERIRQVRSRLQTPPASVTIRPVVAPPAPATGSSGRVRLLLGVGLALGVVIVVGLAVLAVPAPAPVQAGPDRDALVADGFALLEANPAAAVTSFHEALALDPNDLRAQSGLGQALFVSGRTEEARPYLCRGVRAPGAIGRAAEDLLRQARLNCR